MHHSSDAHDDGHGIPHDWMWPKIPSQKEMDKYRVPLEKRDRCAGLFIPLLECRRDNLLLDLFCKDYLYPYLKCRHYDFLEREEAFKRQMEDGKPLSLQRPEYRSQADVYGHPAAFN